MQDGLELGEDVDISLLRLETQLYAQSRRAQEVAKVLLREREAAGIIIIGSKSLERAEKGEEV